MIKIVSTLEIELAAEIKRLNNEITAYEVTVDNLRAELATLRAQEPVAWFRKDHLAQVQRGAFMVGAHKDRDYDYLVPLYAEAGAAPTCTSDEWLSNCPQSVRDLANKIKAAGAAPKAPT